MSETPPPKPELKRRGARLKAWRLLREFKSQDAFADAAEISQPQVSFAESGKRWLHADTLVKVLRTLRISERQLLDDDAPIEVGHDDVPDAEIVMDPKERVRRSWRYEDAPQEARDAFEEWDESNPTADRSRLNEDFYDELLKGFVSQARARGPQPRGLLPGATLAPLLDDPDAPKKA